MFPEHMLSVRATVEPGREVEFNRWYDHEHVPDAVRMFPGCLGAARYKVVLGDGTHQYMALYAFETAAKLSAALAGPEIKALIKQDEVEEALDRLYQFLEKMEEQVFRDKAEDKQEWLDELDGHIAKFNRNEKNLRKGIISEEAANVEKNRIIEATLAIMRNLGV